MLKNSFRCAARWASEYMGHPYTFIGAVITILLWAVLGPHYKYSDTWQLIINTSTTIITFLMVFLIQNTQNRDTKAINLKLDELIASNKKSRNAMINLEDYTDEELKKLEKEFKNLSKKV